MPNPLPVEAAIGEVIVAVMEGVLCKSVIKSELPIAVPAGAFAAAYIGCAVMDEHLFLSGRVIQCFFCFVGVVSFALVQAWYAFCIDLIGDKLAELFV